MTNPPKKLKMHTSDLTDIEKMTGKTRDLVADNIAQLKALFPEVMTEGKINFDTLQELLGAKVEKAEEHYNFTWHGKRAALRLSQQTSLGTLRPVKGESVDWDNTQNVFIEGDNLEVLKLLQKSYFGKVKMIYIDPPYNTGNDFVYKDDLKDNIKNYRSITGQLDEEGRRTSTNKNDDGRYHTNWLNMMYPRLRLARNLMRDDGVIFISIDDNEQANLRNLCDEVFFEDNFVGVIAVQVNPGGRDYGGIARTHDYLLVYVKTDLAKINSLEERNKKFPFEDDISGFEPRELRNRNIAFHKGNRPNLHYPFYINENNKDKNGFYEISLDKQDGWYELYPKVSQGFQTVWRWGKPLSKENLNINIVGKAMKDGGYQIVEKYRKNTKMARSIWDDKGMHTEKGTLLTKEMMGKRIFDFPKPIEMIMRAIEMGSEKDDIILDFFAGSGTTAHAVMQMNAEDRGNRKFICVQLPEILDEKSEAHKAGYKNIADISKERIRRAGKKIKAVGGLAHTPDLGFKVFRLDDSNLKRWDPDFKNIEASLIDAVDYLKQDRSEDDLLFELLLKCGLDLTVPIETRTVANKKIYSIGEGKLVVCLDTDITTEVAEAIAALNAELTPENGMQVILRDEGFKDDCAKTNSIITLKTRGIKDVKSL